MRPSVHLIVFEGFADWEPAFAIAELRRSAGLEVTVTGFGTGAVRSMGGLVVQPERALGAVRPEQVRLLILPGGDMWEDPAAYPRAELERLLHRLVDAGTPVAAICAATLAVGRAGLLAHRRHTSNAESYLRDQLPGYASGDRYRNELAVRDGGLITASGVGPVEFAREIFEELGVFSAGDRAAWYRLFKYGEMPAGAR